MPRVLRRRRRRRVRSVTLGRTAHPITYHGRTGNPVVHRTKTAGKKFIMVRAKRGGTRRLYAGSKYTVESPRSKGPKTVRVLRL